MTSMSIFIDLMYFQLRNSYAFLRAIKPTVQIYSFKNVFINKFTVKEILIVVFIRTLNPSNYKFTFS